VVDAEYVFYLPLKAKLDEMEIAKDRYWDVLKEAKAFLRGWLAMSNVATK
jgi:hypothetical protein